MKIFPTVSIEIDFVNNAVRPIPINAKIKEPINPIEKFFISRFTNGSLLGPAKNLLFIALIENNWFHLITKQKLFRIFAYQY